MMRLLILERKGTAFYPGMQIIKKVYKSFEVFKFFCNFAAETSK